RSMARYSRFSSSAERSGSRAVSRLPSLSRIDRYSTVNRGSRGVLGMKAPRPHPLYSGPRRAPSLRRGKTRRTLLANGLDALPDVLLHEGQHLERDGLVEDRPGHAEPVVEALLRPSDRLLTALRQLVGDLERLGHELRGRHAQAHEADALGFLA